jgi:nitric oxide reductase NorD protein
MEEFVGSIWHRVITHHARADHDAARVHLPALRSQLATFYRAMGGDTGKQFTGAEPRRFRTQRRLLQKIAGTNRRFIVSWQDERSVCLPPYLDCFPQRELNEDLYFWLTAMAAYLPDIAHWFYDNQASCRNLQDSRPGLKKLYQRLLPGLLELRPAVDELTGADQDREVAIRAALIDPGSVLTLPIADGDPFPIPIWFYPVPLHKVSVAADDVPGAHEAGKEVVQHLDETRKQAQRLDDSRETDGLVVFQLASLLSWGEQVQLDRSEEDNQDDDLAAAANDLDIITLSRRRRAGASRVKFDLDLPAMENDDLPVGDGTRLPEWNWHKGEMQENFCLLQPMLAIDAEPAPLPDHLIGSAKSLRQRFAGMQTQRKWLKHQPSGEEIDIDAWIDAIAKPRGKMERQDFFRNKTIDNRDLACLLLADFSMSTESPLNADQRIIDVIKEAMLLFAEALSGSEDRFAIYGFSSVRNKQVRYNILKNFNESYSDAVRGRILAVKPGFYTRMGAAIRQSTEILKSQQVDQRLLLIISDGKPNDIDKYEGRYGIEDTRHAIQEARQQGLRPFCVTIDNRANEYLPYLFGDHSYALISDMARLPALLPRLYLNLTGAQH